jgi:hypothetical protein
LLFARLPHRRTGGQFARRCCTARPGPEGVAGKRIDMTMTMVAENNP